MTGAHGIRGDLRVHSYTDSIDLYQSGAPIRLKLPDASIRSLTVRWAKPHGRGLRMHLESIDDRTQAERLVGSTLFVDKSRLPALEADTYYWHELIGLSVYDTAGRLMGRLDQVIPTPANDVYVVKGTLDGRSRETLIPAVAAVVCEIDLKRGTMIVDPPEGL